MFGNDEVIGNAGLLIQNKDTSTLTVNCDQNYWGAATGPGGDPADRAQSLPLGPVSENSNASWKSAEIKAPLKAQK